MSLYAQTNQINTTGNVGIGTINPTKKLEVNGDTRMTGTVEMDSMVIIRDSVIIDRDAHIKENATIDGKLKVIGNSRFLGNVVAIGNTRLLGNVVFPNLIEPGSNNVVYTSGSILIQNENGRVFKTPLTSLSDLLYNPLTPCLSNANGQTVPIWKNGFGKMYLECPGNLGLGTNDPLHRLHVVGNGYITNDFTIKKNLFVEGYIKVGTSSIYIGSVNQGSSSNDILSDNGDLLIQSNPLFTAYNTVINKFGGKVIIGNATGSGNNGTPGVVLEVAGTINSCKLIAQANGWCDYVFDEDYELMSLSAVKKFIQEYRHLPGVPSEEDVEKNDVDVVEMEKVLLKKVEELTLYMIQMKEVNDNLKKEVELLKKELYK